MFCEPCQASMVTVCPVDKRAGKPERIPYSVPPLWRQTHRIESTCTKCQRKEYVGSITWTVGEDEVKR